MKKCKLCGGNGIFKSYDDNENIETYIFVECENENCDSESTDFHNICDKDAKEKCIEEWNLLN